MKIKFIKYSYQTIVNYVRDESRNPRLPSSGEKSEKWWDIRSNISSEGMGGKKRENSPT